MDQDVAVAPAAACEVSTIEGFGIKQVPPSCHPIIRGLAHESLRPDFEAHVEELLIIYGDTVGHTLSVEPDPEVPAIYFYTPSMDGAPVANELLPATVDSGLTVLEDLEPGEYHGTFDGCMGFSSPHWGLAATDGSHAVRFEVIADHVTHPVVQICN